MLITNNDEMSAKIREQNLAKVPYRQEPEIVTSETSVRSLEPIP